MHKILQDLFKSWKVSKEDIEIYQATIYEKTYPRGYKIFSGEEECRGLVIIQNGALRAYVVSQVAKEINLFILRNDEYCILSASCMLKQINFDVNLEFIETSSVLVLPVRYFNALSQKYPLAKDFQIELVSSRLSKVVESLSALAFDPLTDRVIRFLKESAKQNGKDTKLYITHEEIANSLGSAREAISRVLKDLEKQNKVILKRGVIELC